MVLIGSLAYIFVAACFYAVVVRKAAVLPNIPSFEAEIIDITHHFAEPEVEIRKAA